jgi:inositol phosphorylceramide mannosyltransferase catalytic subunit
VCARSAGRYAPPICNVCRATLFDRLATAFFSNRPGARRVASDACYELPVVGIPGVGRLRHLATSRRLKDMMDKTEKIPRRIIQVWGKAVDLPLLARAAMTNVQLLNPDFEHLFFDDPKIEEFIDTEFPEYRPVFDSFAARIQSYDLFRYLAVYHFGGFYFDTDVLLASGLDDLLGFSCVFPFEQLSVHSFLLKKYGMDWELGNYGFGAVAGHPFLQAIIQNCVRAQRDPEWAGAMMKSIPRMFRDEYFVQDTTGPGLVSRTLAEYPGDRDHLKVLFPENVCEPKSWYCFGSYGVHLQIGTWRKRKGYARRVLHRSWESATRGALMKHSLKRGRKRSLEFSSYDSSLIL